MLSPRKEEIHAVFHPSLTSVTTDSSTLRDLDKCIAHITETGEPLTEGETLFVCQKLEEILSKEANVLNLSSPITICGDIHGQFFDLVELFAISGKCPDKSYLFLGDFVDRGEFSVEVLSWLMCLKVRWPNNIHLIRGNHESRQITQVYGFYDECLRKFGSVNVWRACASVFDALPLTALIDNQVFAVHGGLSPNIHKLDDIKHIIRRQEVPHEGAFCDLLWSDPLEDSVSSNTSHLQDIIKNGETMPSDQQDELHHTSASQMATISKRGKEASSLWVVSPRGAGYLFSHDAVNKFCHLNKVCTIARSHQLIMEGYRQLFDHQLVTVWSAPNYCYRCGNLASVFEVPSKASSNSNPVKDTFNFKTFEAAPSDRRRRAGFKPVPDYFL